MEIDDLIRAKRGDILRVAEQHGTRNVRVFGSAAQGEAGPSSDIDFRVDMEPSRSLFDRAELLADLRELLGRNVDVVTEDSLYWLLRRRISREAKPL